MDGSEEILDSSIQVGFDCSVLGTLTLVGRKTGTDVQTFPIDAERITFGRDYDCDVRLYYLDVSKLHAEISFDATSGKACVIVHGANGLWHTQEGGKQTNYKPPSKITLLNNDMITIRKKQFRFNYGSIETVLDPSLMSPAPQPVLSCSQAPSTPTKEPIPAIANSPTVHSVRRRASHRMSLVPTDKKFSPFACSPAKDKRQSTLDPNGKDREFKMSKLSQELQGETGEDGQQQPVIDVAEGDDGEKVYLENTKVDEEEVFRSVQNVLINPFITPQAKRKAPPRNTSAVPRTRKFVTLESALESLIPTERDAQPALTNSTPLPGVYRLSTETTSSMAPVPAHVALSTPKGPATLRKALLLRSARKVWHETHATGIDGAIQDGHVETRRKSTSPRTGSARKSINPEELKEAQKDVEMSDSSSDDNSKNDEVDEREEPDENRELRWIYEDGQAEISFESDSSEMDSFNADLSLDLPGQGILQLGIEAASDMDMEEPINTSLEIQEEKSCRQDIEEGAGVVVNDCEEQNEIEAQVISDEVVNDMPTIDEEETEDERDNVTILLPGTPRTGSTITQKFFTPQVARSTAYGQIRRSLGPPVRLPATPNNLGNCRSPQVPGFVNYVSQSSGMNIKEEEKIEENGYEDAVPSINRDIASRREIKRIHETLSTPRTLPKPPPSGFKEPVREIRLTNLLSTPSHPALASRSLEVDSEDENEESKKPSLPNTPLNDIRKRLDHMRRHSIHRASNRPNDRRATVGFNLPVTPVHKPTAGHNISFSVSRNDRTPRTLILPAVKREDVTAVDHLDDMVVNQEEKDPIPLEHITLESTFTLTSNANASRQEFPTPSFIGLKQLFNSSMPAQTPDFSDVRRLYSKQPDASTTPDFAELKHVFAESKMAETPDFAGVKTLLAEPKDANTPILVGVKSTLSDKQATVTPCMSGVKKLFGELKVSETSALEGLKVMYESEKEAVIQMDGDASGSIKNKVEEKKKLIVEVSNESLGQRDDKLPKPSGSRSTSTAARRVAPVQKIPSRFSQSLPTRRAAASVYAASEQESQSSSHKTETSGSRETDSKPISRSTHTRRNQSNKPTANLGMARSTRAKSSAPSDDSVKEGDEEQTLTTTVTTASGLSSSRARSTSSRTTRKISTEMEEEVEEKSSRATRGKKPLVQIEEQPVTEVVVEKKSAPSRGAKRTTVASITSSVPSSSATMSKRSVSAPTRTKAASASTTTDRLSVVVPTRRKGKTAEKENDEALAQEKDEKPILKRRATTAGSSSVPVATGRITRSRK
ncbi:uncharacterized protein L203_102536 [Cryptococcus depauperatus CBS 7841]|uniref:FHA domain-containing protein n=1 Tax=Cryptococcus depauperatus CBS 7841 TaxID=1295531 RepID=A0AAJ8M0S6_9TREE